MIKFSHLIFYVKEVEKTIRFYTDCFGLSLKFFHESGTYAELATGEITLAFASEELGKMNLPEGFRPHRIQELPQGSEIVFTTDDPQKLYDKCLEKGAVGLSPPKEKPWGQTVAYVRDVDGILIEIASIM